MNERLETIIRTIRDSRSEDFGWSIRTDDLVRLTGFPVADFYRVLYDLQGRLSFSEALSGFGDETVGELVTFLERLYGEEVEPAFTDAGLFLPYEHRIELTEAFTTAVSDLQRSHTIDYEAFWSMVKVFRSFPNAFDVYISEYFHPDRLFEKVAEKFRVRRNGDEFTRASAERYLRLLFRRHILSFPDLFSWIRSQFVRSGFERGFFTAREKTGYYGDAGRENGRRNSSERGGRRGSTSEQEGQEADAARLLGLAGRSFTRKELRDRYYSLIRRYHPDVNPSGLEMSKRLNTAYAFLASNCS